MKGVKVIRADQLKPGDIVVLPRVTFIVQHVYEGHERVSVIIVAGFFMDFDAYEMVSVVRRSSGKASRTA